MTGKPVELGESLGRASAALWSFGQVGRLATIFLDEAGVQIVAVCDQHVGLFNSRGIDFTALDDRSQQTGWILGFDGVDELVRPDALLYLPLNLLVPAAGEGVIPGRQRGAHRRNRHPRGRELPRHSTSGSRTGILRPFRRTRHSGERWRRHRLLLLVGAGQSGVLVERTGSGRPTARTNECGLAKGRSPCGIRPWATANFGQANSRGLGSLGPYAARALPVAAHWSQIPRHWEHT